jgi:hypothetical protein
MPTDLSVIIPVYNRGDVIRYTLESVRRASAGLTVETIIIDDGSTPPTADTLARIGFAPTVLIRQANQGLLFARLTGLARATGRHVLFLDSDDLVSPEKFRLQLAAMERSSAEISYTDSARCEISGDYEALQITPDAPARDFTAVADFCIVVQPPPHSPIFRTDWLRRVVDAAFFPPSPLYNSVAEIWFYHNAAPRTGRAVRVPGPHTIIGSHPGPRLTNHWERLAVASLAVQEAFARTCPVTPGGLSARAHFAAKAFTAWRRLPHDFSPDFSRRLLALFTASPVRPPRAALGGRFFRTAAALLGPVVAGRMFRHWQAGSYSACRTIDDAALHHLLAALPPP